MRIGFDAKRAFSNHTGLGNYSRFTINALSRLYSENEYFLFTPSLREKDFYEAPANARLCLPDTLWLKQLKGYWRTYGINKQLKREGIELFHGLSNEIPLGIEKTGVRSVVTIHDLIFMRFPELYKPIDRRIYQKKTANAVKNADRIIAISRQTKDDLVELLGVEENRIRIIYQGCNPWFYEKKNVEELAGISLKYSLPENYILYIGTIEERKNLLEIIRALHEGNIDIPLVAIGKKTSYFDRIAEYIAVHNVPNIIFHHHIENHDLPSIYQKASALVYPSRYEGFGIPVLEALNSGIPVITSRGGCLEETAGDGGLSVTPGNTGELSEAIRRVIHDTALKEKLVKAGMLHALKFREENTIPQLNELYKECLR